jgi:hypothetical protein
MTRRIRRAGITAIALTALVAGTTAVAGAAAVPRTPRAVSGHTATSLLFTSLNSTTLSIKDSHGVRLHLTLGSTMRTGVGRASLSVSLATGSVDGLGETHSWSFSLPRSDLSYNRKTGHGKLATHGSLKAFGTITLAFAKKSQSTSKCKGGTGHDTRVTGRLSGKLFFNTQTGSHGWGKVGSRTRKVTFSGASTVSMLSSGCPIGTGGGSASCISGLFWSAPFSTTTPSQSTFGNVTRSGSRTKSTITFDQFVDINSPAGTTRTDLLVAKEPAPTVNAGTLTITTSGHAVTGSATINNTTSTPNNYKCKSGKHAKTEKTVYYTGMWTASPLAVHFGAIGTVDGPTSGSGSFTTESF